MKKTILVITVFFIGKTLFAQNCVVLTDSLKGNYVGHCKKGLANGEGKAAGADFYTGNFKNGYPDGQGKYRWKNGNWYEGQWEMGKFNGQGTFHNANAQSPDSADLAGFWKQGTYLGKYEKPYNVRTLTNGFNEVDIRKTGKQQTESNITITVRNTTGGGLSLGTLSGKMVMEKVKLTDMIVQQGRFDRRTDDESSSTFSNWYVLRNVEYPFYAILSFGNERMQIELQEKAGYDITISFGK